MPVLVKICGITDKAALEAAVGAGARFVGFVFYARSPRCLRPAQAGALRRLLPPTVTPVGVFADAADSLIDAAVNAAGLGMLQLHGDEPPDRVAALRRRCGVAVMKAIKVAREGDVEAAADYAAVADWIMFDAKAPAERADTMPGGNALVFDWRLLAGGRADAAVHGRPWMLSGGLGPENVAEAIAVSGARAVDVSSGVETAPGRKSPERIAAFVAASREAVAEAAG